MASHTYMQDSYVVLLFPGNIPDHYSVFSAKLTDSDSQTSPLKLTDVLVNHNNVYNPTNGVFTVPYSGDYYFISSIKLQEDFHGRFVYIEMLAGHDRVLRCGATTEAGDKRICSTISNVSQNSRVTAAIPNGARLNSGDTTFSAYYLTPCMGDQNTLLHSSLSQVVSPNVDIDDGNLFVSPDINKLNVYNITSSIFTAPFDGVYFISLTGTSTGHTAYASRFSFQGTAGPIDNGFVRGLFQLEAGDRKSMVISLYNQESYDITFNLQLSVYDVTPCLPLSSVDYPLENYNHWLV